MTAFSTTFKPIDRTVGSCLPLSKESRAICVPVKPGTTVAPVAAEPPTITVEQQLDHLFTQAEQINRAMDNCVRFLHPYLGAGGPATFLLALCAEVDGKLAAATTKAAHIALALMADCLPLPHHTRIGFHEPKRTQHIGVPVERTTSDYLDVIDMLRENHIVASRKGHLDLTGALPRFVEQRLVGAEAAYDDLMGDEDMTDRADIFTFGGESAHYEAHLARIVAESEANRSDDYDAERERRMALATELRLLRAEAGDKRVLIQGGRERFQPASSDKGADGKLEPTSVHRNEHASTYDVVAGNRVLRHAMAQDIEEPHREAAHSDEFDAGSGIKKAHTHVHLGLSAEELDEQLRFEEHERGENAIAFLEAMEACERAVFNEGVTSDAIGWFKAIQWDARPRRTFYSTLTVTKPGSEPVSEVTATVTSWRRTAREVAWVCRHTLDESPIVLQRTDSDPYVEERGAADAVFVSEADYEEAYITFA